MMTFNSSKNEEELAREQLKLDSKSKQIFKLELEISNLDSKVKFSMNPNPNSQYFMWQTRTFRQQLTSLHSQSPQFRNSPV